MLGDVNLKCVNVIWEREHPVQCLSTSEQGLASLGQPLGVLVKGYLV